MILSYIFMLHFSIWSFIGIILLITVLNLSEPYVLSIEFIYTCIYVYMCIMYISITYDVHLF